jgi:hypothetical protein
MRHKNSAMLMSVFVLMFFSARAYSQGQEVNTLFGGIMTDKGRASWALQVEYKQLEFLTYKNFVFDGSFSYINEGRPIGHRRDGVMVQGWARMLVGSKLNLSLGTGPYFYNDTVAGPSPSTNGLGFVTSFDATYDVSKKFSVGARLNETIVPKGQNATSLLSEIVYRLPDKDDELSTELKNQIAFLTLGIPGDISDLGSVSQLRFTRVITDHIEAMAANFFGRSFKEKGVAAEACVTNAFGDFKTGVCAGPYYDHQRAGVVDIASLFGDYNFKNTPWSVMIIFDRTSNLGGGRGIDATCCGVGYRF